MDWYYVDTGKQAGPVSDAEFEQLVASGKIQSNTLIWREGMANWLAYGHVNPNRATTAPAIEPPPPALGSVSSATAPGVTTGGDVVCVQCNRIVPRDQTIQYGTAYVCAECKPTFVQKLKEGAVTPTYLGAMDYAGFWIRFGAKIIDGLVMTVVLGIPAFLLIMASMKNAAPGRAPTFMIGLQVLVQLAYFVMLVGYNTILQGKYGATLGKMACGLKVVAPDGTPISYGRAFGRAWAEILSGMICDIGYIIAAFDIEKRSLHDHIANTRVIRVR